MNQPSHPSGMGVSPQPQPQGYHPHPHQDNVNNNYNQMTSSTPTGHLSWAKCEADNTFAGAGTSYNGNYPQNNNPGYYYGHGQRQEDYGFYNSQDHSCRQGGGQGPGYGYHNHQEQHFAGGGFDHQQGRSSGNPSCAMGGGGMNPSNNVWYYPGQSHTNPSYPGHGGYGESTSTSDCDFTARSINRYNNNYHHQDGTYFPPSYGQPTSSRYPPNMNHHNQYHTHNQGHHHPPFRRKSVESYHGPPYNATSSPVPVQQPYCSPVQSPSSPMMIKRECLSNPPPPVTPTSTPPPLGWVRNSSSNSSANSSSNCTSTTNNNEHYGYPNHSQSYQQPEQTYQQQQQQETSFKSCQFEQSSNHGSPSTPYNNSMQKPCSVKHRSLSIPAGIPGPANYNHGHQAGESVDKVEVEPSYGEDPSGHYDTSNQSQVHGAMSMSESTTSSYPDQSHGIPQDQINSNCDDEEEEEEDEECEDEDDEGMETSSLLHEFDVDDIPESDMIIAEDEEEQDPNDDFHENSKSSMQETSNSNHVISTTDNDNPPSEETHETGNILHLNTSNSNNFTFSIKRSNSISSYSTFENHQELVCDSAGISSNPQKISKRSFSDSDKDQVTYITDRNDLSISIKNEQGNEGEESDSNCGGESAKSTTTEGNNNKPLRAGVVVPKGWKREISFAKDTVTVYYVSPSDTKLRTLDELRNYIGSDGTCKCGLSCPLSIELAFSFDPKVVTLYGFERSKPLEEDDLMYLTGFKEHPDEEEDKSTLCNHYRKRKGRVTLIPKSEDSPLISSTREDLGEGPERKKRRASDSSEFSTSSITGPGNVTPTLTPTSTPGGQRSNKEASPPVPLSLQNSGNGSQQKTGHVSVPCSQQSPDTTTQTPQTEMSPASSVSSEPSFTRSRSSPTPPQSNGKYAPQSSSGGVTTRSASKGDPSKKLGQNQCYPSKPKSQCPNVNVRSLNLPEEQNRPPRIPENGPATPLQPIAIPIQAPPIPPISPTIIDLGNGSIGVPLPSTSSSSQLPQTQSSSLIDTLTTTTMPTMMGGCGFTISPMATLLNPSLTFPTLDIQKLLGGEGTSQLLSQFQPQVLLSIQNPTTPIQLSQVGEIKDAKVDSSGEKSSFQLVQDSVNKGEEKGESKQESKKDKDETDNEAGDGTKAKGDVKEPSSKSHDEKVTDGAKDTSKMEGLGKAQKESYKTDSCSGHINTIPTTTTPASSGPHIILQSSQPTFTTAAPHTDQFGQLRYPFIQTIQPFFSTQPLIISSSQQTTTQAGTPVISATDQNPNAANNSNITTTNPQNHNQSQNTTSGSQPQPSFIYQDGTGTATILQDPSTTLTTSMPFMFDPSGTFISGLPPITLAPAPQGGKKKKKRLSKKQQQQQAQLQLQQQLLIQQIQAQHQAQQALNLSSFPLTIFPQSTFLPPVNTMPFFQPQTILTLPNLILNSADGTLFIQPSAPLSTSTTTSTSMPSNTSIIRSSSSNGNNAIIAPKGGDTTMIGNDTGSEDCRRNPTPDSSTGDVVISTILGSSTSTTTTPIPSPVISNPLLGPQTTILPPGPTQTKAKTSSTKSRAVSSTSTTTKRIFHQKQILPKIDSTTSSND